MAFALAAVLPGRYKLGPADLCAFSHIRFERVNSALISIVIMTLAPSSQAGALAWFNQQLRMGFSFGLRSLQAKQGVTSSSCVSGR